MLDKFFQNIDGYRIRAALWNNQVGIRLGRLNMEVVHGLDDGLIAIDEVLNRASTFDDIAAQDTDEALVAVGIDKDLHVEDSTNRGIDKGHDAFEDDERTWLDAYGLGETRTGCVIIYRLIDGSAFAEQGQMLVKQFPIEVPKEGANCPCNNYPVKLPLRCLQEDFQ